MGPIRTTGTLVTVSLALLLACPTGTRAQEKPAGEGWVSLFNGKDLSGWVPPKGDHTWKVVDGVLDYEAKGGSLATAKAYGDYELHVEWRFKRTAGAPYNAKLFDADGNQKQDANGKPMTQAIPNADSGIFVRGSGKTQVNLWCWPCGSGQLWGYHKDKDPAIRKGACPKKKADKPVGEWNAMRIVMKGEQITVVLNGETVIDTRMPGAPATGPIVLQHHGGYNEKKKTWNSASALIQFRNLWIRERKGE